MGLFVFIFDVIFWCYFLTLLFEIESLILFLILDWKLIQNLIFSVSFKDIQNVAFPAVTVCAPNSGKWQALAEALNYFDQKGLIFDTAAKLNVFLDPFASDLYESNKLDVLMKQFVPNLKLDRTLPTRLNSLPCETEVLYWLHFACYVASYECGKKVIAPYSNFGLKLILSQKTRYQTAFEICQDLVDYGQQLIDYEDIDCLKLNDTTIWERCLDDGNNTSLFQQWCKSCSELSGCTLYVYGFKKHYKKSYCHFAIFS